MSKLLTFSTAAGIAAVMAGIAFINKDSGKEPSWDASFFGLVLVYLVLASVVPAVMVPIGLTVVLWQVLHSAVPEWFDKIARGPA